MNIENCPGCTKCCLQLKLRGTPRCGLLGRAAELGIVTLQASPSWQLMLRQTACSHPPPKFIQSPVYASQLKNSRSILSVPIIHVYDEDTGTSPFPQERCGRHNTTRHRIHVTSPTYNALFLDGRFLKIPLLLICKTLL